MSRAVPRVCASTGLLQMMKFEHFAVIYEAARQSMDGMEVRHTETSTCPCSECLSGGNGKITVEESVLSELPLILPDIEIELSHGLSPPPGRMSFRLHYRQRVPCFIIFYMEAMAPFLLKCL
jgi:hypothetical protein